MLESLAINTWRSCWERVQIELEESDAVPTPVRDIKQSVSLPEKRTAVAETQTAVPEPTTAASVLLPRQETPKPENETRGIRARYDSVPQASFDVAPIPPPEEPILHMQKMQDCRSPEKNADIASVLEDSKPASSELSSAGYRTGNFPPAEERKETPSGKAPSRCIELIVEAHRRVAEGVTQRAKAKVEEIVAETKYRTEAAGAREVKIRVPKYRTLPVPGILPEGVLRIIRKYKEEAAAKKAGLAADDSRSRIEPQPVEVEASNSDKEEEPRTEEPPASTARNSYNLLKSEESALPWDQQQPTPPQLEPRRKLRPLVPAGGLKDTRNKLSPLPRRAGTKPVSRTVVKSQRKQPVHGLPAVQIQKPRRSKSCLRPSPPQIVRLVFLI